MKLKIILTLILTAFTGTAYATPQACPALTVERLSESQIGVIYQAFEAGRGNDMSYSLAAIAWQESQGGKYMINLQDPSSGVFHITINNALSYIKWRDTPFNRNRVAQLLIDDFELSAEFAMINLQFWKDHHGNDWNKIWGSYNGGYRPNMEYASDIASKIQKIKLCEW